MSGTHLKTMTRKDIGVLVLLGVLCAVVATASPQFLSVGNLQNVGRLVGTYGIFSIGVGIVIITGGIDLSVGSVLALSMMVVGWTSHNAGWPLSLSILAAILIGGLCGLVNGLAITVAKLPPFIATLAMLSIARGLANVITDGQQIVGFPDWFSALAFERHFGFLTITALVLVVLLVAGWAFLRYRPGGRSVYAVGGSAEVARLAGPHELERNQAPARRARRRPQRRLIVRRHELGQQWRVLRTDTVGSAGEP